MEKNILIVAQDFPYPANHGGRVDVLNRIISLKSIGFKVYLIVTVKNDITEDCIIHMKKYCQEIFILKRRSNILLLFSMMPYQIKSRQFDFDLLFNKINNINFYSIIIEGHYVFDIGYLLSKKLKSNYVLFRVQNDEIKYFFGLCKSTNKIANKLFYFFEALKFINYEKKIIAKANINGILHISFDEKLSYENKFPNHKHIFLPASVDLRSFKQYKMKSAPNVLFVGSLFMPNNIEGLKWYIKNVHSKILNKIPDYKLIIVGNSTGVKRSDLDEFMTKNAIELYESPENLTKYYEHSIVFINPMLNGAGVKLKTINALVEGIPTLSTIVGNEGTGLQSDKHILIANTEEEFAEKLLALLVDERQRRDLVINSQHFLKENYNQCDILKSILLNN